jgi:ubiquinone biosynthesis monooxygenase Coq7
MTIVRSPIDSFICVFDRALRVVGDVVVSRRESPSSKLAEVKLSDEERKHSAGLMRVNHVGEVCAQALYEAQALFARDEVTRQQFEHSGAEELDHLAWTAERLRELNSRPSLFNPLWYAGAFAMGVVAARLGDKHSLGFVVETERQVEAHLNDHLNLLPKHDDRSRAIVMQMRDDEIEHGAAAQKLGAAELPEPVRLGMRAISKVMTSTAYYL